MKPTQPSRRAFLKTSALAGLSAAFASSSTGCAATKKSYGGIASPENHNGTRPAGQKSVHDLTTKPLERIRVAVIGLGRGMSHVNNCLNIEGTEVVGSVINAMTAPTMPETSVKRRPVNARPFTVATKPSGRKWWNAKTLTWSISPRHGNGMSPCVCG